MNFHQRLIEDYAAVRARLGAGPRMPVMMLEAPRQVFYLPPPEPQSVCDPVPDQRGLDAYHIETIGLDAELIAARRALAAFARLREEQPSTHSARHVKIAIASAFKVDVAVLDGPCRRQGAVRIRHIAMMIACQVCAFGRTELGRRFNRDHSTVWHAQRKMEWLLDGAACQIGEIS